MFVHCIWIVGAGKGKGHGKLLLRQCEKDARRDGMNGVAMVTSEGTWLVGKDFLRRHGYESIDQAPPSFELMVKKFHDAPSPSFTGRWDEKAKRLGRGLTIVRSEQCPYVEASVNMMLRAAKEKEIPARVVELTSSEEVRRIAPSAYGVFGVVMDGKLVSYHPMGRPDFLRRIDELRQV